MDSSGHHDPTQNTLSALSSASRKRSRENETPSQRHKREKAAERQRRKRERDRNANNMNAIMAFAQPSDPQQPPPQHQQPPPPPAFTGQELTPEEMARRERVRAAARDRQRKHRQLVKQRKMRELGLEMGSEMMAGMEDVHYRVNSDGQYQAVLPHELHQHAMNPQEPPFPQGQPLGGQTFASTLLLSFSCAPLLKQHLLRTLQMTNEELTSLEPIIAEAWDHWDHQRRMHYAQQAANAVKVAEGAMPGPSAPPYPTVDLNDPSANAYATDPSQQPHPSDFRARFHRSIIAPSPFRPYPTEPQAPAPTSTPTSTTGSGPPSDPIDPHLTNAVVGPGDSRQKAPSSSLDPDLGQARGEAEGVVGRLERG
ncbi:hypothetical protein SERLA73DRAFT_187187 [Serpula lacrymans var. lacrymans S7.3]|uniref:Uncharacterized protein n=2 Tax=Serpula lacrymans var. lacrymans TaxID=341189 RepID=F8Q8M5_SERL3|nr:uncharacterized protein SERLADRAFT_476609 [Serpula lacrymans var. lacrymans S7.9]EGN95913.1 hypothetical protein SERLA73DRAFT_187187 [Serpula lacrymans var. lacrymans S7.3]EGO21427.1 hypothetical protein SERLADRAFT_476609 [Serpula lacrymans var. lacrymans S7.9]